MSTSDNPFAPPTATLESASAPSSASLVEVPGAVIAVLGQTRPWVKLVSVLLFVFLGIMALVAIVVVIVRPTALGPTNGVQLIPVALISLLYVAPAIYLWRYARGIRRLQSGGGLSALQEALANQKSFWKFSGIMAVVMMGLYAIGIASAGLIGVFMRKTGH